MKHNLRFVTYVSAIVLGIASTLYAGVPSMTVTVFDAAGTVKFKGATDPNGVFGTANLPPGNYVVQFNAKNAAAKQNSYLLVVSAGKKKVIATGVSGQTFMGGGVAMRVNVGSANLKITGQLANEQLMGSTYKVVGGQRFVWVPQELGTNMGGHWAEATVAPVHNTIRISNDSFQKLQDRAGEGSMVEWDHHMEGTY